MLRVMYGDMTPNMKNQLEKQMQNGMVTWRLGYTGDYTLGMVVPCIPKPRNYDAMVYLGSCRISSVNSIYKHGFGRGSICLQIT